MIEEAWMVAAAVSTGIVRAFVMERTDDGITVVAADGSDEVERVRRGGRMTGEHAGEDSAGGDGHLYLYRLADEAIVEHHPRMAGAPTSHHPADLIVLHVVHTFAWIRSA